jgi:dihydrofolate reductase
MMIRGTPSPPRFLCSSLALFPPLFQPDIFPARLKIALYALSLDSLMAAISPISIGPESREQEYAMAELTLTTFMTLDGVMQAPGGPHEDTSGNFRYGGWLVPHADADMVETMVEIFVKASAFLLGRRTYDIFSSYWPAITDPDNPIAVRLNTLPKFIASQSRADFRWDGSSHIDDVVSGVADLKSRFEGEVQVHGSCGLAQTLIENDLIDEYRLLTFPVVLGTGKRLFGVGAVPTALSLARCKTTSKGVVVAAYRRAGPLETGSFALD